MAFRVLIAGVFAAMWLMNKRLSPLRLMRERSLLPSDAGTKCGSGFLKSDFY